MTNFEPYFCYGTQAFTPCGNGVYQYPLGIGQVSYKITNHPVTGSEYVVTHVFRGKVRSNWKMCHIIVFRFATGGYENYINNCVYGVANAPIPTCTLMVPTILNVPTTKLDDFVISSNNGFNESKGTLFNVRINCPTVNAAVTPSVTFSYGEDLACRASNGANAATAAKGIGFAIKTSVTGTTSGDYICGNSTSGNNVLSFPTAIAGTTYDQSKTLYVNYATQSTAKSAGSVQTNVTLTLAFD